MTEQRGIDSRFRRGGHDRHRGAAGITAMLERTLAARRSDVVLSPRSATRVRGTGRPLPQRSRCVGQPGRPGRERRRGGGRAAPSGRGRLLVADLPARAPGGGSRRRVAAVAAGRSRRARRDGLPVDPAADDRPGCRADRALSRHSEDRGIVGRLGHPGRAGSGGPDRGAQLRLLDHVELLRVRQCRHRVGVLPRPRPGNARRRLPSPRNSPALSAEAAAMDPAALPGAVAGHETPGGLNVYVRTSLADRGFFDDIAGHLEHIYRAPGSRASPTTVDGLQLVGIASSRSPGCPHGATGGSTRVNRRTSNARSATR